MGILDAPGVPRTAVASSPVSGSARTYDPRLCVYNLKPKHLRRTRMKLGKVRQGAGFANIAFVGDSTTQGTGATNPYTDSWPAIFRSMLSSAGYPMAGSGLVGAYQKVGSTDPRWSFGTGWGSFAALGSNVSKNNTTTNPATFTSVSAGISVDVWYDDSGTGSFTVAIDGGAAATVTNGGTQAIKKATYTGLANTTHTVVITPNASSDVHLLGVDVRTSDTTGVKVFNAALASAKTSDQMDSRWWCSPNVAAASGAFNADTIFINLGINDVVNSIPIATTKANLQTIITNAKAGSADVILINPVPSTGYDFGPLQQAIYQLADSNDLPVIDIKDRWSDWATANGNGIMFDANHPNPSGYADVARLVFNALAL